MDDKHIQDELVWMEQELRNIKSPQGPITNVNAFTAFTEDIGNVIKITYEDGDNDIITRVYVVGESLSVAVLSVPENNQQLILIYDHTPGTIGGYRITSTRPILSVENFS